MPGLWVGSLSFAEASGKDGSMESLKPTPYILYIYILYTLHPKPKMNESLACRLHVPVLVLVLVVGNVVVVVVMVVVVVAAAAGGGGGVVVVVVDVVVVLVGRVTIVVEA